MKQSCYSQLLASRRRALAAAKGSTPSDAACRCSKSDANADAEVLGVDGGEMGFWLAYTLLLAMPAAGEMDGVEGNTGGTTDWPQTRETGGPH